MIAVVEQASSVQSVRMAELWLKYNEPKRPIVHGGIEVHWRWSKAGLGKTRYVWEKHGLLVYTPTTYKWWEGYDGHKVVLIDEFRGDWCKFVAYGMVGHLISKVRVHPKRPNWSSPEYISLRLPGVLIKWPTGW